MKRTLLILTAALVLTAPWAPTGSTPVAVAADMTVGEWDKRLEKTLDNIENLISRENFRRLGWNDAGATLADLAKIRVYVRHPEDYEACRAVCEQRLGEVPAIYAVADVCRPDLLVEIEGVAFSSLAADQANGEAAQP